MDTDERLIALKKAYADIILNTSKEAAARVVASETKAFRLEKELNESKEQALQMLLRLKKMMDCKAVEAEMTSYNQQRQILELNGQLREAADTIRKSDATSLTQNKKIEELEAQLNEAEDIVKDLREELKEAHTKLEIFRKNKPYSNETFNRATNETEVHIENLNVGILSPVLEENTQTVPQEKVPSLMNLNSSTRNVGNSNERKAFIPSILLKSKGPEVCGNRRTQRIRAFEEKLMAGELSFTDTKNNRDANHEKYAKENRESVDKKVSNVRAAGRRWRKLAKCKTKKISTTDLYNRSRKIEEADNALSEEEPSNNVLETPNIDKELNKNLIAESEMEMGKASMDIEEVDVPAATNETETPGMVDGIAHPVSERIFKYTFQRKRKRELGSSSEDAALKENTVERPNFPQEMEKCGSIIESSRDSRRLALVAHQLLSLSEKKW